MLKKGELRQQAGSSYGFDVISFSAARSACDQGLLLQRVIFSASTRPDLPEDSGARRTQHERTGHEENVNNWMHAWMRSRIHTGLRIFWHARGCKRDLLLFFISLALTPVAA
eukprot:6491400-Karenia_brevis.AAC.1